MRKIQKRLEPGIKLARPLIARAATLTLPYDARCKSRLATHLDTGEAVAVLRPRGTVLAEGDLLVADDGALVRVTAAAETLMRVTGSRPLDLIRAAYHLGNRHTQVQLGDGFLQLEVDPVLRQMLQGIGMHVETVEAPFQPEAGAYGGGHRHGHDESFAEDYALAQNVYDQHDHGHRHGHDHGHHDHDHAHAHGGHDHDHGHEHEGHGHGHHDHDHAAHGHKHSHDDGHVHDEHCNHGHSPDAAR